jgi:outer membrane protein OmpA-like peptidoglycan-associated protein
VASSLELWQEVFTQLPSPVEIAWHTESLGSARLNQVLSEQRALRVKHDLEQHFSLPDECLLTKGYGKSQPRASNETESGRRQNRRIEVALPES